jgi:NADPH:quinone reductase-like Zn-dependent oxidoreductase
VAGTTGSGKIGGTEASVEAKSAKALWYVGPRRAELRPIALGRPGPGEAFVETLWSGISRGTERLVFEGRVPPSEYDRMRAPVQDGDFPFPVKYGYCAVGRVAEGPREWLGQTVFALHPHQDGFNLSVAALTPIPERIPPRRAILAAHMETALNALWDSGAGPGDRIVVVGAGVVGLLVARLAAGLPGAAVHVVDVVAARAPLVNTLGATFLVPPERGDAGEADIVFHASASSEGLAAALAFAGLEATIVEMSWYGDAMVDVPLGGSFHSKRLRLISSQVGHVAASRRPRWTHQRRLAKAMELLDDARLDGLISDEIGFADLPREIGARLERAAAGLFTAIRY